MRSAFFTGKTKLIGVWHRGMGETFHGRLSSATEQLLRADGYAMLSSPAVKKGSASEHDLHLFNQWSVDGLLSIGGTAHLQKFLAAHPEWRLPMVHVDAFPNAEFLGCDTVYVDVLTAVRDGLERWITEGRCRIAMLSGHDSGSVVTDPREVLYRELMGEHGRQPELIGFEKGGDQRTFAERYLREYVVRHGCPDAIFCRSDEVLMGAYRALRLLGHRIPDDVALLGVDGIRDLRYLEHPVATVAQPVDEMCHLAWELLQGRMADPAQPPRHKKLAGSLCWPVCGALECGSEEESDTLGNELLTGEWMPATA